MLLLGTVRQQSISLHAKLHTDAHSFGQHLIARNDLCSLLGWWPAPPWPIPLVTNFPRYPPFPSHQSTFHHIPFSLFFHLPPLPPWCEYHCGVPQERWLSLKDVISPVHENPTLCASFYRWHGEWFRERTLGWASDWYYGRMLVRRRWMVLNGGWLTAPLLIHPLGWCRVIEPRRHGPELVLNLSHSPGFGGHDSKVTQ